MYTLTFRESFPSFPKESKSTRTIALSPAAITFFERVIDKNTPKNGKGVQPEVLALPTVDDIRKNADFKVIRTMELIKEHKEGIKKPKKIN